MSKRYLILGNGNVFEGEKIGAEGESIGELVFTTGMTGYLETLTDPSYAGQIIMQTFPLIGNYGVIPEDFEGDFYAKGYVVRDMCTDPSNFRSEGDLDSLLKSKGICGIAGVDTRELTRIIREEGTMNAMIADQIPDDLEPIRSYEVGDIVPEVSCDEPKVYPAEDDKKKYNVTLIDYGVKMNMIRLLTSLGCEVTRVPSSTSAEEILAGKPDGVFLSNGPGDPEVNTGCIAELNKILGRVPVFGVCLGHQLTALAMGGKTIKLKYGHRGANQPVSERGTNRTFMSTQNHGYAVLTDSLGDKAVETFINANDGSCEGLYYPDKNCYTVQFHPEHCAGPKDAEYLFGRFTEMMDGMEDKDAER